MEIQFFFSAHCLMMFRICTKIGENILTVFKLLSGHDFHSNNYNGYNSVKIYVELQFLCSAHRLVIIYICQSTVKQYRQ